MRLLILTQREAICEVHDRVRQCFTRHKFATYGDALGWWHEISHETQKLESGEQGMSKFAADILWLTSIFGPKESVDYKVMATRRVPTLKHVAVLDPDDDQGELTGSPKTSRSRRKTRRRRRF